jgi:hypothetical protein
MLLPYDLMSRKDKQLHELEQASASMVQGSLSESTRQCGDPSCTCAHDPAYRHGPHLYFRYKAQGKVHSVYVPAELGESVREAQNAWHEFQQIGAQISAQNRERLLSSLERQKQLVRAKRSQKQRRG